MAKFNVSTPSGFPEFSPKEEFLRQKWVSIIKETYEKYGFMPINTPIIERTDNLLGKGGNAKEIYVIDRLHSESADTEAEKSRALRFDQTVPFALYVARHFSEINFPFKRSVMGPVFRGERPQKGRFRQFDQCDIDIIGNENLSLLNDAQIPAIIIEIFKKLNIGDFIVRINNRKILTGFFASLGVDDADMKKILNLVDDRDKVSAENFQISFEALGLKADDIEKIIAMTSDLAMPEDINSEFWENLKNICDHATFQEGVSELKTVIDALEQIINKEHYAIDFGIARGLDYYTGTVYETTLTEHPRFGSVCSGGRYQDLAKIFTNKTLPGVGISIGLTRLFSQCLNNNLIQPEKLTSTQVLLIAADEIAQPILLRLGSDLRESGVLAENYLEKKKISKKFDFAQKQNIPFVVIMGENEIDEEVVQIKNMETGHQQTVILSQVEQFFKENL